MDTSIAVVIAIVVVFVVAVPAMIRRSATELSRVDIDRVPDQAQVIDAEALPPCRDHTARARVFHPGTSVEPAVPRSVVEPRADAPRLTLSAPAPRLSVIDGGSLAEATPESSCEAQPLPVAVGQAQTSYRADLSHEARAGAGHEAAGASQPGNVRRLHPAVHAVFEQSGSPSQPLGPTNGAGNSSVPGPGHATSRGGASGAGTSHGDRLGAGPGSHPPHASAAGAQRSGRAPGTGRPPRPGQEQRTSKRNFGADEELSMTENTTALQESMSALGTMIRGFSLVLLASLLGILVTGVLALFSLVHPALLGVFAGLSVVSLLIVRTLNMRKWELKRQIRALDESRESVAEAQRAGRSTETRPAAERKAAGTTAPTASVKAAQARAVIERNASAKRAREEATTGEIPIVRVRNEAAEGHTTRQVLLTGPIPTLEEPSTKPEAAPEDAARSAGAGASRVETTTVPGTDMTPDTERSSSPEAASGPDSARSASESDAAEDAAGTQAAASVDTGRDETGHAASGHTQSGRNKSGQSETDREGTATISDPFTQRLKARDGWSPTPLPVPSYVGAPEVDHPVPAARKADVTSYEIEPRSREDIAAQFAAELGYRPELSDSAREEGPLAHGRTAIRTSKAPELGAVNDVLARRRA